MDTINVGNIVPTSGLAGTHHLSTREIPNIIQFSNGFPSILACTSVVTEIHYRPGKELEAEIEFLSPTEWTKELEHLLSDIADTRKGRNKKQTQSSDVAQVAWDKVSAT